MGIAVGALLPSLVLTTWAASKIFKDVPENSWYFAAVNSMQQKGLMKGYADNSFKPNVYVTRAELAQTLENMLKYQDGDLEVVEEVKKSEPQQSGSELLEDVQKISLGDEVSLAVPFTTQAPYANWDMPYQEACEESALIMVKYFLNEDGLDADTANKEIVDLVAWESDNGMGVDIGVEEAARIAEEIYDLEAYTFYGETVSVDNIKKLLMAGYPVIIPVNGQTLDNPNFLGFGPPYHMVVLTGFDKDGFFSHDPGTSKGKNYKYSFDTVDKAIHDWTGSKKTIDEGQRAMLVLSK